METVTIIATTAGQQNECAPFIQTGKSKIIVNYHAAIAASNTYNICKTHVVPDFKL
jgi:hypothetical protein